jgi:site-specific DNA recombinase
MAKSQKALVAIYVRKSRLKEDDSMEISRQLELLTDYAEKNNMDYEVFSEEGNSEDWNRVELNRMLKELKRGIYDGVLCTDQDRISRDRTDFGLFVRFMKAEGLLLFTLNKTFNFMNDEDVFVSGIQSEMDNHFMRITKRKLKRGRIQALQKGRYFGVAPYGYNKDSTKHLIPHPEESKVVQNIFSMYVSEGLNQAEIVEQLTLRGKLTRHNKPFTARTISVILSNIAYTGVLQYSLVGEDVILVEDAHTALIDTETFNTVQNIRKDRRVVPQSSQRGVYALSRLLKCPNCHTTLSFCMKYNKRSARNTLDKSQRELYVLNCHASKSQLGKARDKGKPRCANNGIKSSRLEEELLIHLKKHLLDIDYQIEQMLAGNTSFLSKVAIKQDELTLQFNKLNEQRKKVQDGFKMGIYSGEEAKTEINSINEMQESIEQELKNLEGRDIKSEIDQKKKVKDKIETILSQDDINPTKMNKMLHEVIDKIFYWKEENDVGEDNPFVMVVEYKE